MADWPVKRMDEVCEITSSKRIFRADYVSEGVPFYRGKEITEKYKGNLDVTTELFITEEKFKEIEQKHGAPKPGDMLLTSVGTLGSAYIVKPRDRFYFKDGNLTWFRNLNGIDSQYLYYWIGSPQGKAELQKATIGSSQSAYTIVLLKGMQIELPPLEEQRRIAGVLSAYDDLIENCQRRIQVLEKMARTLYREWFIHFRYPGRSRETGNEPSPGSASHPLPKGEGMNDDIPEGWETTTLGDLVKIRKGKNITKKTIRPGDIPVVAGGLTPAYFHDTANTEQPVITISASGANAGFVNMYYVDVWASDCSVIDSTATPYVYYFYLWLKHHQKEVTHLQRGAAQPHVYPKDLVRLEALDVPDDILKQFNELVSPKFQLIKNLTLKIQNLRRTRDLLLPRLLAGQI